MLDTAAALADRFEEGRRRRPGRAGSSGRTSCSSAGRRPRTSCRLGRGVRRRGPTRPRGGSTPRSCWAATSFSSSIERARTRWHQPHVSRRQVVRAMGGGLGLVALADAAERAPPRAAAAQPPLRPEGEAGHSSVHERRAVPVRPLRPQAGAQQVRRDSSRRGPTSAPSGRPAG